MDNFLFWQSVLLIGIVIFLFSVVGIKIGNIFGTRWQHLSETTGGIILIAIGLKVLLEGLGLL